MSTRTFTVDELEDLEVGYVNELKESVDSGRWTEHFEIVFKADDDKLYLVSYDEGLTEMQEMWGEDSYPEARREGDDYIVECPEVEIYEEMVPVKKWRKL